MIEGPHLTRQRTALAVLCAAALAVIAACSSSSKAGGAQATTSGAQSSVSSATSTTSSAAASGPQAEVAAAKAALARYLSAPTSIPVTAPLTTKPAPGKTMVFLKCDVGSCAELDKGMQAAVAAAGWKYKAIAYKSADPATLVAGLRQALNYSPAAVALSGIPPEAGWASMIPVYKAAHVPIITSYVGDVPFDDTLIAAIGGTKEYQETAKVLANWFISDSQAAGTAVLQRVDDFPILKVWADAFAAAVKQGCSGCKIIDLKNTIPDVFAGKVIASSVSALRSNSSAGYLIGSDVEFLDGIDSALAAAGLTGKVKIAGDNPTIGEEQKLKAKTGAAQAYIPLALDYSSWSMVDVALRHSEGLPFTTNNNGMPTQLLLPGGDFEVGSSYNQPADFESQFKKLWLVG